MSCAKYTHELALILIAYMNTDVYCTNTKLMYYVRYAYCVVVVRTVQYNTLE